MVIAEIRSLILVSNEKMVFPDRFSRRFNGLGKVSLFYEYYESGIFVVPSEITKELIDSFKEELFAFPDFTLSNKEWYAVVVLDMNICLAIPIQ